MRIFIFVLLHSLEMRRNETFCKLCAMQMNAVSSHLFKWMYLSTFDHDCILILQEIQSIDEMRILHCFALLIFAWGDQIALTHFYTAFVEYSLVQKLSTLCLWSSNSLINVWTCEAWNLSFGIDLCVNLSQNSVSFKHLGANFQHGLIFTDTVMYL